MITTLFPFLIGAYAYAASLSQPPAETDVFALYFAGAETLFSDPKDEGLLRALRMIDDRIAELPNEIPDFGNMPPDLMPAIASLLSGPLHLRMGIADEPIEGMPFPVYVQLDSPEATPEDASKLAERLTGLFQLGGLQVQDTDQATGLRRIGAPVPAWMGVANGGFRMALGKAHPEPAQVDLSGLPAGVTPSLGLKLNYARYMEMIANVVEADGGPEAGAMIRGITEQFGIDKLRINMACGSDSDLSYMTMKMPGYVDVMNETGTKPEGPLKAADFGMIPADSAWAFLGKMNVVGTFDLILGFAEDMLAQQGMTEDPIDMLANATGIHLERDLIDHMGSTYGMYASDKTGGGGLLSTVLFMELASPDGFEDTKERIEGMLNGMVAMQIGGYVEIRHWEREGTDYTSLTFPGVPIPIEPTCVISDGYLLVGLTPQAAVGAVHQAKTKSGNLLDNQSFRQLLPGGTEGLYATQFFDTPRLLDDGYGIMTMLTSALVNGTRSPHNERNAGMILPPFYELKAGAKASVSATRYVGSDVVQETRSDPSVLVNMTSLTGFMTSGPLLPLFMAGAVGGAVTERKRGAQDAEMRRAMEMQRLQEQLQEGGR